VHCPDRPGLPTAGRYPSLFQEVAGGLCCINV